MPQAKFKHMILGSIAADNTFLSQKSSKEEVKIRREPKSIREMKAIVKAT